MSLFFKKKDNSADQMKKLQEQQAKQAAADKARATKLQQEDSLQRAKLQSMGLLSNITSQGKQTLGG